MRLGVTVASRFAEALLMRGRNRQISLVIVEGATDSRFYRRLLDAANSHILWLNGKDEAIELAEKFRGSRIDGVVTITDADLDRYFGRVPGRLMVWTSETDMEVMVLLSDAYLRVVPNLPKYDTLLKNRERLFSAALPLSALRALSQEKTWGLDFKQLIFKEFINPAAVTCDVEALCEELLRNNLQFSNSAVSLVEEVNAFVDKLQDQRLICHGHDLCRILAICTTRLFSGREITFEQISQKYELSDFELTSTWADLATWETHNQPFLMRVDHTTK